MYFHRHLEDCVLQASKQFSAVLLVGPRQVGKTTLLRHLAGAQRTYVTLDDPRIRLLAQTDPALFFQQYRPPLLIDEVQYAPQLFAQIKMMADASGAKGLFWLTGSQQFQMMQNVTETLAGRVAILNLFGMSAREEFGLANEPFIPRAADTWVGEGVGIDLSLPAVYERILRGSYPAMVSREVTDRELFYRSYLQTYIERDVRSLTQVGDSGTFVRFVQAAAARSGQLLNYTDLANDTGVSVGTTRNWLGVLQASLLVRLLEPYHTNITKRITKTPKLYFLDTGLCAYLAGWSDVATLSTGAMAGAILETFVVGEVVKTWEYSGRRPMLAFYRDKEQQEVDLLIGADGKIHPVEIKRTASPQARWLDPAYRLGARGLTIGEGAIVCFVQRPMALSVTVRAMPAGLI